MKNRIRMAGPAIRSRREMEVAVGNIRDLTIRRNQVLLDREAAHKVVDENCAPVLEEMERELERATEHLRCWAEANPGEFDGLKSLAATHGEIGWRTGQPTLKTLSGWTWGKVLELMKTVGPHYVRVKEEVNKQAMLADRETLGSEGLRAIGVKVVQEEVFYVEPKIEEVENRQVAEKAA